MQYEETNFKFINHKELENFTSASQQLSNLYRWNEIPHTKLIDANLSPTKKWIFLLSGGISSTATFWKFLTSNISSVVSSEIVHFFDVLNRPFRNAECRIKVIEQLGKYSKNWAGEHWLNHESSLKIIPWFSQELKQTKSFVTKTSQSKLQWTQTERIYWILSKLSQIYKDELSQCLLFFGWIEEPLKVDSILKEFGVEAVSILPDLERYPLILCECEATCEQIYYQYGVYTLQSYEGPLFPRRILQLCCSCENEPMDEQREKVSSNNQKAQDISDVLPFHPSDTFSTCCNKCYKCRLYNKVIKEKLLQDIPMLIMSDRERGKLRSIVTLTSKAKAEKWVLGGTKFEEEQVKRQFKIYPWEKNTKQTTKKKTPKLPKNKTAPNTKTMKGKIKESLTTTTSTPDDDEDDETETIWQDDEEDEPVQQAADHDKDDDDENEEEGQEEDEEPIIEEDIDDDRYDDNYEEELEEIADELNKDDFE